MKLRRILAGFLAGAIAMTSSVVMSVTASAAEDIVLSNPGLSWGDSTYDSSTGIITYEKEDGGHGWWIGGDYSAYESVTVNYSESTVGTVRLIVQYGDDSQDEVSSTETSDSLTVTFDETSRSTVNQIIVQNTTTGSLKLGDVTVKADDSVVINYNVWEKQEDGTYQYKAISRPNDAGENDWNDPVTNTEKAAYLMGVAIADYIPDGFTASDVTSVSVTLTIANGSAGCSFGMNVPDETGSTTWTQNNNLVSGVKSTISTPNGISESADLQVGVDWLNYGTTLTVAIEVEAEAPATPTTYKITINGPFANGTITSDKQTAKADETVTLTVTPAENYQLNTLEVVGEKEEQQVDVTDNKNGTYSFTMPEHNVAVNAEFTIRKYKLTAKEAANGKFSHFNVNTTAQDTAPEGAKVEIVATGGDFYELGGAEIEGVTTKTTSTITGNTFTMPAEDVIVTPKFIVAVVVVKPMVDDKVEDYATVTKPSTYTVEDYKAELENAVAGLVFKDITVDTSALKETKSTTDATGSITGTVTFKSGEQTITTLTANVTLDKVPTDPVAIAAEAVETYLAKVTFDNEFHATNQSEAIKAEVAKAAPEVRVDANFTVKAATEEAEGSVKGRIMLVADGSELKTIEVNKTIAKLPAKDLVYDDNQGMLVALKADGTVLTQKATQANGQLSQRFVKKINKADLEGAKEIQYKFSDGTKSLTKADKFYYEKVAGVSSGETEVFLSATMKNIPVGVKVNCEITIIK